MRRNWSRGEPRGYECGAACGGAAVWHGHAAMTAPQHAAHVWPRVAMAGATVHPRRAPGPQPAARKPRSIEELNVQLLIASTSIFSQEFKIG